MLGPLRVLRHGAAVHIGGRAQRKILAMLLVNLGSAVPDDRLIHALWGDEPPVTAVQSLRTHVYRLRRVLQGQDEEEYLVTTPLGYMLNVGSDAVDTARFEHLVAKARDERVRDPSAAASTLAEALALWRGEPFAEFEDMEATHSEAARLAELRLTAAEDLLDAQLASGDHAQVASTAEALIAAHPGRERMYEQLMTALYRCGRQLRALEIYQDLRDYLGRELGVEPSLRLRALQTAILRQDPELDWNAPAPTPSTLPVEHASFVGRAADVRELVRELTQYRVVCLVGPGGVGKSRLALRVARQIADRYSGGAWWCDLATITAPEAVVDVLATSLGVQREATGLESGVVESLSAGRALLVLDNCEHVADEASRVLAILAQRCPGVTILVTSRTSLDVPSTRIWPVEPLPVGATDANDASDCHDPSGTDLSAAVQLFLERARAVRPTLSAGPDQMSSIEEICRRLDGLPLAIELAAARMRALNPADITTRLDDRFRLLSATAFGGEARHHTLRAVVDWSFDLLSLTERQLFARLSAFAGEFPLVAVEQVCAGHPIAKDEVVDLLGRLVDASMVTVGSSEGEIRYRLLETLRAYGHVRLRESAEAEWISQAHARYYVALAEDAAAGIRGPAEPGWVALIDQSFANLREAFRWSIASHDVDVALRLPAALFRYALWGLHDEVFRWAEAAVELAGSDQHWLWPRVCGVAGWGHGLRDQRSAALRLADDAMGVRAWRDDHLARVIVREVRAHVALWEGRLEECVAVMSEAANEVSDPSELMPWTVSALARTYAGEVDEAAATARIARSRADALGNPSLQALARYSLAEALLEHDPDGAATELDQVIELSQRAQNRMLLGVAGVSVTSLRARHGDPGSALRASATVLDLWQRTSDWTHLWVGLRSIAELFARVDADEAAGVLLGCVADSDNGPPVYGADAERLADLTDVLDQRIGAERLSAARRKGSGMTAAEVMRFTRAEIDRAVENV